MESAQYSYKRRFPDLWAKDPAEIEFGHLVHCSLKIGYLAATILLIFHWGNFFEVAFLAIREIFRSSKGAWPKCPCGKKAYAEIRRRIRTPAVRCRSSCQLSVSPLDSACCRGTSPYQPSRTPSDVECRRQPALLSYTSLRTCMYTHRTPAVSVGGVA